MTTLDISGLTPEEYRAVLDKMGVETRPAAGIFLHRTAATGFGYRIVEIWDTKEEVRGIPRTTIGPSL